MEAIRASRPQEMKSSTSQRAGSSRTFLKTMYLTSGAKVMTSRLRTRTSPVDLYSAHRAWASSGETRFLVWVLDIGSVLLLLGPRLLFPGRMLRTDKEGIGPGGEVPHPPFGVIAPSIARPSGRGLRRTTRMPRGRARRPRRGPPQRRSTAPPAPPARDPAWRAPWRADRP